jgi:hypothetical protein
MNFRLALLPVLLAGIAAGQDAQISGLIQDPSLAAVSDAEITLRNDQTGGRRTTHSSDGGIYSVTTLKPGLYRLTVRARGFETIVREGIELQVGENARIDFTLHIGDSQTTITVTGGAPLMNQDDASVGTVIDRNLIDRMPLNGRGIQTLIDLSPGVVTLPVIDSSRGQFVINGQRSDANYFTIDGINANFATGDTLSQNAYVRLQAVPTFGQAGGGMLPANNFLGTFSNLVSPEALQEFKIQTSTYAPEAGALPGGQINLITRSGGSRFSGSLFEYFRNDKTDANDWFLNAAGAPRDPLRFNNFGSTFSGPLRLPHRSRANGRGDDRSFFFLSMDTLIIRQPLPAIPIGVPSLTARQHAPPALAAMLDSYPLPTSETPAAAYILLPQYQEFLAGYTGSGTRRYDQQAWSLRVDQYFGPRLIFFAHYDHAPAGRSEPITNAQASPSNIEHYDIHTDTLTAGLTYVITPSLVNDVRGNFSQQSTRDYANLDSSAGGRLPPASEVFPRGYSFADSTSQYSIGGAPEIFLGTFARDRARQYEVVDNLSWTRGAHRFRFGADYRRFLTGETNRRLEYLLSAAIYNPDGSFASESESAAAVINIDNDIEYLAPSFSAYAQDAWQLNRRFALTYGARWEVEPAPRTTRGAANAVGGLTDLNDASNTYLLPPGHPFYPTSWTNVAPRVGFGWQLFEIAGQPAVLRAGAGRFFNSAQGGFEDNSRGREVTESYGPLPLGQLDLSNPLTESDRSLSQYFAVAAPRGYNLPSTYGWNVTLEQAIGRQTVSAGYVGALGRHLIADIAILPTVSQYAVHVVGNDASSSYNAMQLQWNRRFSGRLQILASYTWSHSIDNLSNDISPYANNSIINARTLAAYLNPNSNRGSSDFDVRHSVNGAVIVELPGRGHGLGALLRGWRANSIFFARSPLPFSIVPGLIGYDHLGPVAGQPYFLYGSQYPGGKRLNPNAFTEWSGNQPSTPGRNALRGFPAWQIDFALHREIRVAENRSMEFRAEAFNILNHPNFANPATNSFFNSVLFIPTRSFGIATAMLANGLSPSLIPGELNPLFQIGGPRIVQLALRLKF